METKNINKAVLAFRNGRSNLLLMIIFTAVNLVLATTGGLYLLFSAPVPQIAFEVGAEFSEEYNNITYLIVGLIVSLTVLGTYFACWHFSLRKRSLIKVAYIIFLIEVILFSILVGLVSLSEFDFTVFIQLAFLLWILYYLRNGAKAYKELVGISTEEFNKRLSNITITEGKLLQEIEASEDKKEKKKKTD